MTKEIEQRLNFLLQTCSNVPHVRCTIGEIKLNINELFESNICIPKGEILQIEINGKWQDILHSSKEMNYRIKPSEPVYEWQWCAGCMYDITLITNDFYTEEEIGEKPFSKIVKTKRERT